MARRGAIVAGVLVILGVGLWLHRTSDRSPPVAPPESAAESVAGAPAPLPDEPTPPVAEDRLAEHSEITGRVLYEDGEPVEGYPVECRFRGHLPVEHASGRVTSAADGSFRFPAVLGAPYLVFLADRGPGLSLQVRGGDSGLLFPVRRVPRLLVRAVDEETGTPVPVTRTRIRWKKDGRSRHGGSSPSGAVVLPRPEEADRGTVCIRIRARGYEPTELVLDVPEPGERTVRLTRLERGARLLVRARRENGDPWSGKGRVLAYRGQLLLEAMEFVVEAGEGLAEGLCLGADRIEVLIEDERAEVSPGPMEAGETARVEMVIPARWELVIDPAFEGNVRPIRLSNQGTSFGMWGGQRWPVVLRGKLPEKRKLVFTDDGGVVATATVELVPGERSVVRPRIPALADDCRWTLVISPVFEGRRRPLRGSVGEVGLFFTAAAFPLTYRGMQDGPVTVVLRNELGDEIHRERVELVPGGTTRVSPRIPALPGEEPARAAPTPAAGGPGVLTGSVTRRTGGGFEWILVEVGRFAEPGEPPGIPCWFETEADPDGTFRIEGLPPGRYGASILPKGAKHRLVRFTVPEDGAVPPLHLVF